MDEEILKNIWNALSSDKKTESDFETWKSNFSGNSEVQDNVHVYLTQKGYTKNDLETWRTNLGIKKKDNSDFTSEEVVTESTTDVETNPSSLDSSSTTTSVDVPLIEETLIDFPNAPERKGVLENEDGSVSTHKMKTETLDGKNWVSFPTIFQNENGEFVDMSEQAESDWKSVYEEAKKRGEVIDFLEDKDSAIKYGEGAWKQKYNANKKNNLLEESGYLAYANDPERKKFMSILDNEELSANLPDYVKKDYEKQYGFVNPETGETEFKKESEINPSLLEAIKEHDSMTGEVKAPNYVDVDIDDDDYSKLGNNVKNILRKQEIDVEDYLKWQKKNTRNETKVYKWMKTLLPNEEGDQYFEEKNAYEKVQSYKTAQLNQITKRLEKIQSTMNLTSDRNELRELEKQADEVRKEFYAKVQSVTETINYFPKFKEYTEDADLRRRKAMYKAAQEGGLSEGGQAMVELAAVTGNGLVGFATDFFGGIPGFFDQRIATLGGENKFDGKGVLKGLEEMFTDSAESLEGETGAVQRQAFIEGKPVFQGGNRYIVDGNGTVYDQNTNIRMDGIIPSETIKKIVSLSKDVTETEVNWTGGAVLQGGVSTLVNLFALIRTGGKVKGALGLKGKKAGSIGMGISSFVSSVAGNVEDVRSQLVASGMSEKEALDISVNAGQAIATLDGIFSGLAGGNEKLLVGFQGIKDQIKNLAVKEGKKFTVKQLVDKGKGLVKENAKELFIEELPVYFSEKGINHLVNRHIGNDVLNDKITRAGITETVVMTVGATSTLGGKKLLSGNKRANLVRLAAANVQNLQATLDVLVKEGSLTQIEASNAYTEIYNAQSAELKTQGTVKMTENIEPAADLLTERQNLINKKQGLEGPGKVDIDKQIAAVDQQLDALYEKDKIEVQEQLKKENDAIQEPSTEKQVLQDDAASKEDGAETEVGLQQVGKGDVESDTTQEGDTETETETDQAIDTTTQTDTEQLTDTTSETEVMSVNKERVDSIVDGIVEKTKSRNVGKSTNPQKVADNAIEYIKGSKLFEQSNDIERENIIRDVSKQLGVEIKAPTAKKLLGIKRIGKPKTIKVKSDYAAMKKDLQKEAKVARDAKNDVNSRRKGLQNAIDLVVKAGNISTKKANSLLKKVSNVNLYNAKKVQDVIDFTTKAMNDAEYSKKLDKAKSIQKAIKKKLKGKEAGLSDSAKKFSEVNPSNVADIDVYLEKATEVSKGLQPTRKPSKGKLKVSKPFDIKKMDEYSKKEVELEAERNYELAKESFQELTGLEPGDLTLDQMKDMMYEIDGVKTDSESDNKTLKKKEAVIDKAVKNAFKNTKINIKGAIESGDIKVTKEQKTLIDKFLNMDLDLMTTKQKMEALDSIINFELNQSTGGMDAVFSQQVGAVKMNKAKNQKIETPKNPKLFGLGSVWNKYISTLPNVFELAFKSQKKARIIMDAIGLNGIINGSAKAQTEGANTEKDYANAFSKKKMQDGIYFDEANDTERAILADVRRFTPGTEAEQQKEFDDSKNLIKETYERLMESGDKLKVKKGEIVKAQYDKLLKDSNSIADVESKVDPVNLEGVKYVTEIWSKKYNDLANVSLNIYNRNLGKDVNYTPRNIRNVAQVEPEVDITQPVFNPEGLQRKNAYDKKTGVLKEATKPSSLGKGKVLNLSFDSQNMSNYKAALTDIYTASSIQQVKGARDSKAFNEVFTDPESRDIINKRINGYVDTKRGKNYIDGKSKRALNRLNKLATLGVARVLGGPTQMLKQIVPIFNTGVNAGVVNTLEGAKLMFNPDVRKAINESGLPIANRGISSQTDIENADSRIAKKANTFEGKAIDIADSVNKKTLEIFLVNPDVATAKASFIAYYLNAMNKKGVKTSEVDFTKPLDKEAAQFAQQQVDRQQNTSDQDLQGDLFTSQKFGPQLVRKTLFPFANFLLNQKTRMYSDINTLYNNPTAEPGAKKRAIQSLVGLGLETTVFNSIGLGITQAMAAAARALSGEDEELGLEADMKREERDEKDFMNRVKGRTGNMIADIVSPIPVLNDQLLDKINGVMGIFQDDEKDPWKFFSKTDKGINERLGVLGIGIKKGAILTDMIKTIVTGEKTTEYMGKKSTKKIEPDKLETLKGIAMAYTLHLIGVPILNSTEVGYISERAYKNIGKMKEKEPETIKPITIKQMEKINPKKAEAMKQEVARKKRIQKADPRLNLAKKRKEEILRRVDRK
tara:strand:- start:16553 stop:23170 length:6618 start_codon:yes stop_codon:yes gene_type:complete